MSNPYAPPEDRPRSPAGPSDAPTGQDADGAVREPGGDRHAPQPPPQWGAQPPPGWPAAPPAPGDPQGPPTSLHGPWPQPRHGAGVYPPPEPAPEDVEKAARDVRTVAVLLVATVLVSGLALPWRAASVLFCLGALGWGVRTIVVVSRANVRGGLAGATAGLVAMSALLLTVYASQLAVWPLQADRDQCLAGALTVSAQRGCDAAFEDRLKESIRLP